MHIRAAIWIWCFESHIYLYNITAPASWGIWLSNISLLKSCSSCPPLAESAFNQCQNLPSSSFPFSHSQWNTGETRGSGFDPRRFREGQENVEVTAVWWEFLKYKRQRRLFPWWATCFLFTFDLLVQRLSWTRQCTTKVEGERSDCLSFFLFAFLCFDVPLKKLDNRWICRLN